MTEKETLQDNSSSIENPESSLKSETKPTSEGKSKLILEISSSTLDDVQVCGRKCFYRKVRRITPLQTKESLESGSLLHKMLEVYYNGLIKLGQGFPTEAIIVEAIDAGRHFGNELSLPVPEIEVTIKLFMDYCQYYSGDTWIPLEAEKPFARPLYEDENIQIIYRGKVDLIVMTSNGKRRIVDHKKRSRNVRVPRLANQAMGYCWALGEDGFYLNSVGSQKSLKLEDRMSRTLLSYNQDQLEEWRAESVYWAMTLHRYAESGYWPMQRVNCTLFNSVCDYEDICSKSPEAREIQIKMGYQVRERHELFSEPENPD